MVDERCETQGYIDGKNISKHNLFRMCYMQIRWYRDCGLTKMKIRDSIFAWAKKHGLYIKYNVNDMIDTVFNANAGPLRTGDIKINRQDIANINKRFDNMNTKLVALAMLCYAKAHADKHGEFTLSSVSLSLWLNINRQSLRRKYIKELVDYEFLTEIGTKPQGNRKGDYKKWSQPYEDQSIRYKINSHLHNSGEYGLRDNDVRVLFSEIFSVVL